jgi:molybdate transport system substrate-binding protein
MDDVASKGLIDPASRRDLLGNTLVLIAHGDAEPSEIGPTLDLSALLGEGRLAMAFVDSVPAGIYGREALTALGLWDSVATPRSRRPRTSGPPSPSSRSARRRSASSTAPTPWPRKAAGEDVSVLGTFPPTAIPHHLPAALVAGRDTPAARDLLDHLASPGRAEVFGRLGFTPLD